MPYDPNRVNPPQKVHDVAKEFDEMIEALALGIGDKAKETMDAIMIALSTIPTVDDKKKFLVQVIMALAADNLQEHLLDSPTS